MRLVCERALRCARLGALIALLSACGGEDMQVEPDPILSQPVESLASTLAQAAGDSAYIVDTMAAPSGRVAGVVKLDGALPPDLVYSPTHDQNVCGGDIVVPTVGTSDGVGETLVWLTSVTHGPRPSASMRVTVALDRCRLTPRVQTAPVGGTLLVRSGDNMDVRLRFSDVVETRQAPGDSMIATPMIIPRALVTLGDAGAVVAVTSVLDTPGLVAITDDKHPWITGWIAVAPHPFVAVTSGDGRFVFDNVPTGNYVLVAWHERLGRVAVPVMVERGVEARLSVKLPGR